MAPKPQKRKSYTAEFKLEAVRYALEYGNRPAARRFGVHEKGVRTWRKEKEKLESMPATKRANRRGGVRPKPLTVVNSSNSLENEVATTSDQTVGNEDLQEDLLVKSLLNETVENDPDFILPITLLNTISECQKDVSHRPLRKSASKSYWRCSCHHDANSHTTEEEEAPGNKSKSVAKSVNNKIIHKKRTLFSHTRGRKPKRGRPVGRPRSTTLFRSSSRRNFPPVIDGVTKTLIKTNNASSDSNKTIININNYKIDGPELPTHLESQSFSASSDVDYLEEKNEATLENNSEECLVKMRPKVEDILDAPLTENLCEMTADELNLAAGNFLHLCKRVSMENDVSETEKLKMIYVLSQAVNQAFTTLQSIPSTFAVVPELHGTFNKDVNHPGEIDVASLLQHYSDRLLLLIQERINIHSKST